jgi:hypothetical protein
MLNVYIHKIGDFTFTLEYDWETRRQILHFGKVVMHLREHVADILIIQPYYNEFIHLNDHGAFNCH